MEKSYDKKLFRLVKLLNLLQDTGRATTLELAEEFNVSRRTAQRDILRLTAAGFPVVEEETEKGTYRFVAGYSLRKLPLSDKEASLLVFTCEIARQLGKDFESAYKSIFAKLLSGDDWVSPFYLMTPKAAANPANARLLEEVRTAIERHTLVRLTYNSEGKSKTYTVEPLKLLFCEGYWYLVSRLSGMEWIFKNRLDRIENMQVLEETFRGPKDLDKILRDSSGIWFTERRDKKVVLRIDAEIADSFISRKYFPLQKIKKRNRDGSVVLETRLCHYMEVLPTIYRGIPYIKVLSPRDLAAIVRKDVAYYLRNI